jgi:hypothetical protein
MVSPTHGDFVRRVRSEYLEMPGLRITASEAQRLFGLDAATCDDVLDGLVKSGFLTRVNGIFTLAQPDAPAR